VLGNHDYHQWLCVCVCVFGYYLYNVYKMDIVLAAVLNEEKWSDI